MWVSLPTPSFTRSIPASLMRASEYPKHGVCRGSILGAEILALGRYLLFWYNFQTGLTLNTCRHCYESCLSDCVLASFLPFRPISESYPNYVLDLIVHPNDTCNRIE